MHVVVDGHNLIKQSPHLGPLDARDPQAARDELVDLLAAYRAARGHRVTIVFDGGKGGQPLGSHEERRGVTVIFSRLGEEADEVIRRMIDRGRGEEMTVASSDGEILDHARRAGKLTMTSPEFESLLRRATAPGARPVPVGEDDDEPPRRGTTKKGPAHRLPRKERREQAMYRKL